MTTDMKIKNMVNQVEVVFEGDVLPQPSGAADAFPQLFGLWPRRPARSSGGRNNRHGIRMWNRSRLHYLRIHVLRWLDDTTAFI